MHRPSPEPPQYLFPDPCQQSRAAVAIGWEQGRGKLRINAVKERRGRGRKQDPHEQRFQGPWNVPLLLDFT